jgi:hypothetical protein
MPTVSQNLHDYLPPNTDAVIFYSADATTHYLGHYFSPWTEQARILSNKEIKQILLEVIAYHTEHPGYALTRKRHDAGWMAGVAEQAQLHEYPNIDRPGIAIMDTEARLLPATAPSFKDIHSAWNAYPFDDLQQSYLTSGTPLRILHIAQNHAWYLVLSAGFFGWVKAECVAFVSEEIMQIYQTANYVVPLKDCILPIEKITALPVALRIGNIYPIKTANEQETAITISGANATRHAVLHTRHIPTHYLSSFPYSFTLKNIADVGQEMIGNPYGWGGIGGYRDCSSTLADLMSTFGLWLPRNSRAQIEAGSCIDLKHLTPTEKLSMIREHADKFQTLLYFPGHIMLYLGGREDTHYAYHSASRCYGTVITPLDITLQGRTKNLLEEIQQMRCVYQTCPKNFVL